MSRIYLNLTIALRSLYIFKIRSVLALLGVFLGTFSVIVVLNLSGSFAGKTASELDKLGKNLLIIKSGIIKHFGAKQRHFGEANNLTIGDAVAIYKESGFAKLVCPAGSKTFPVRFNEKVLSSVLVTGVYLNYQETRNFKIQKGRFFTEKDEKNQNRVVTLGTKIVEKLFGDKNPLGKYLLIRRVPCKIIGIMEEKGSDIAGADQDDQIFIPLNTFLKRLVNKDYIDTIYVQAVDHESIASAKREIEYTLRKRHKIKSGEKDDFTVIDLKDVNAIKNQTMHMITVLGKTSAVISFLIGGIGILSIMILIVNERRVEIGIRRAVGSKKRDIIFQFLLESSIISLFGGLAGVFAGFSLCIILFSVSNLPFYISPAGLIFSFFASVIVGIMAGIYPAQKAITIQPVDIIRS